MNRTALIRKLAKDANVGIHRMHTNGPNAAMGNKGQVAYVIEVAGGDAEKQALVAKLDAGLDAVRVYRTDPKFCSSWMRSKDNVKVVFDTRANGEAA